MLLVVFKVTSISFLEIFLNLMLFLYIMLQVLKSKTILKDMFCNVYVDGVCLCFGLVFIV